MTDPGLEGRTAIVTGANHGIGEATARAFAAKGAGVIITYYRLDPEQQDKDSSTPIKYWQECTRSGEEVAQEIRNAGGRASAIELDLSEATTIPELFDHAEAELGPVDILVHNASGWGLDTYLPDLADWAGRPHERISVESHDKQFSVNARAGGLLIAEFTRRHVERKANWGRIIGLTSGGPDGFPGEISYGAAKAALNNYVMSAAQELGRHGITANMVHPPATQTGWITSEIEQIIIESSPLNHVGQPDEVAEIIVFLASEQARYLTGNILKMH